MIDANRYQSIVWYRLQVCLSAFLDKEILICMKHMKHGIFSVPKIADSGDSCMPGKAECVKKKLDRTSLYVNVMSNLYCHIVYICLC